MLFIDACQRYAHWKGPPGTRYTSGMAWQTSSRAMIVSNRQTDGTVYQGPLGLTEYMVDGRSKESVADPHGQRRGSASQGPLIT